MLRLRVRPPGSKGHVVTLKTFPVQIGRGAASSLRLDDPFVSRLHAELRLAEGGPRLFDLGSGNGTFLNGLRVGTEAGLEPGDRIRLGNTILELETEAAEAPARATRRTAGPPASDEALALAAREIKARLLPPAPPVIPGYELAGGSQLSAAVGGESFLFLDLGGGRVLLAEADASGLALDAALLTASLHAALSAQADLASNVGDLAGRLNAFLGRRAPAERFVTLFLAVLDAPGHRLSYVNAGHPRPLLVRADGASRNARGRWAGARGHGRGPLRAGRADAGTGRRTDGGERQRARSPERRRRGASGRLAGRGRAALPRSARLRAPDAHRAGIGELPRRPVAGRRPHARRAAPHSVRPER